MTEEEEVQAPKRFRIEPRVSWGNIVEIGTIVFCAAGFYFQTEQTKQDLAETRKEIAAEIKPAVEKMKLDAVRDTADRAALELRLIRAERDAEAFKVDVDKKLTRIEDKQDGLNTKIDNLATEIRRNRD